jgi:hypothetical protein
MLKDPITKDKAQADFKADSGVKPFNRKGTSNQENKGLQYPFTASLKFPIAYFSAILI